MEKPVIKIVDAVTKEETVREMTQEEYNNYLAIINSLTIE